MNNVTDHAALLPHGSLCLRRLDDELSSLSLDSSLLGLQLGRILLVLRRRDKRGVSFSALVTASTAATHLPLESNVLLNGVDLLLQLGTVEGDCSTGKREAAKVRGADCAESNEVQQCSLFVHTLYMFKVSVTSSSEANRFFWEAITDSRSPPLSFCSSSKSIPILYCGRWCCSGREEWAGGGEVRAGEEEEELKKRS